MLKKLVRAVVSRARARLWRTLERVGAVAHPTNASGNNQSQR